MPKPVIEARRMHNYPAPWCYNCAKDSTIALAVPADDFVPGGWHQSIYLCRDCARAVRDSIDEAIYPRPA